MIISVDLRTVKYIIDHDVTMHAARLVEGLRADGHAQVGIREIRITRSSYPLHVVFGNVKDFDIVCVCVDAALLVLVVDPALETTLAASEDMRYAHDWFFVIVRDCRIWSYCKIISQENEANGKQHSRRALIVYS